MEPYLRTTPDHPQPLQNLVQPWWNFGAPDHPAALAEPRGNLAEAWWNPGTTLMELYLRTWWNPGRTLVERWWNAGGPYVQPSQLVEPWWNPGGTLVKPWWNPRGTLVEPHLKPPRPGGTLVEPWWSPRGALVAPSWNLTSNHPGPPRSPRRTWWNSGGTVVEPWWNPRGTLPQGRPGPPRSLSGLRPQSFQLLGKNL